MWTSDEWYDYLKEQDQGLEWLEDYHPEALVDPSDLGAFF
jgi:hypothetical protein